jgi:hypothetical protein
VLEGFCGPPQWGPQKPGTHFRTEVPVSNWAILESQITESTSARKPARAAHCELEARVNRMTFDKSVLRADLQKC